MNADDAGAADGTTSIDFVWKRRLSQAIDNEEMPTSLLAACATLDQVGVDLDDLEAAVEGQRQGWKAPTSDSTCGERTGQGKQADEEEG